jgi:hypothetical protein
LIAAEKHAFSFFARSVMYTFGFPGMAGDISKPLQGIQIAYKIPYAICNYKVFSCFVDLSCQDCKKGLAPDGTRP